MGREDAGRIKKMVTELQSMVVGVSIELSGVS